MMYEGHSLHLLTFWALWSGNEWYGMVTKRMQLLVGLKHGNLQILNQNLDRLKNWGFTSWGGVKWIKTSHFELSGRYLGPRRTKQSEGRVAEHHPSQLQPAPFHGLARTGAWIWPMMPTPAGKLWKTTAQYNLEKIRFLNPSWSFTWRDAKRKNMKNMCSGFGARNTLLQIACFSCRLFLGCASSHVFIHVHTEWHNQIDPFCGTGPGTRFTIHNTKGH